MPTDNYEENKVENKKYKKLLKEKGYARDSEFATLYLPDFQFFRTVQNFSLISFSASEA